MKHRKQKKSKRPLIILLCVIGVGLLFWGVNLIGKSTAERDFDSFVPFAEAAAFGELWEEESFERDEKLLRAGVLSLIKFEPGELSCDGDSVFLSKERVEKKLLELFGERGKISLKSFSAFGTEFSFCEDIGGYLFPVTGLICEKSVKIKKAYERGKEVFLVLDCFSFEDFTLFEGSGAKEPNAKFSAEVVLVKNQKEEFNIKSAKRL